MLPCWLQREIVTVREYVDPVGKSPFGDWFNGLNGGAAAKVAVALYRSTQGNFLECERRRSGVYEYKIDFGPGYRVYFGKDSDRIVILLGGSSNKQQSAAIAAAQLAWTGYKQSKLKLKKCSRRTK